MRSRLFVIVFFGFTSLWACNDSFEKKEEKAGSIEMPLHSSSTLDKKSNDSLLLYVTSEMSDSLYSLQINTYSFSEKVRNHSYPCVTRQEIIFKREDSIIQRNESPLKNRIYDSASLSYFSKYIISGIATHRVKHQLIYMLYFFAANGEAEYYFYYNQQGKLLFSQNCSKTKCLVECYDFEKKSAIEYCNDESRNLKIKEVTGVCH
jgi:hypothetical protein